MKLRIKIILLLLWNMKTNVTINREIFFTFLMFVKSKTTKLIKFCTGHRRTPSTSDLNWSYLIKFYYSSHLFPSFFIQLLLREQIYKYFIYKHNNKSYIAMKNCQILTYWMNHIYENKIYIKNWLLDQWTSSNVSWPNFETNYSFSSSIFIFYRCQL